MFDFDWKTAAVTLLLAVPGYYALRKITILLTRKLKNSGKTKLRIARIIRGEGYALKAALRHYCNIQLDKESTKFLPVPGSRDVTLRTDDVYIPLSLESSDGSVAASVSDIWGTDVKRIRIVGDPGSGKSSLTKQLFRQACRLALVDSRKQLPILINLKDFIPPSELYPEEVQAEWGMQRVRKEIGVTEGSELGKLFENSLDGRGILLLLDGLDEVASESFHVVAGVINSLSSYLESHKGKSRIILTMRTQFHQQVRRFFIGTFPPTFYIQQFKPGEIHSFLRRWPFPERERRESIDRLYSELTDKPTLREMCSNPLVLAMYVARDQHGQRTGAADNRTGFYKQVTEELLVARRSRQLGASAKSALLQQREKILGRLALENLLDRERPTNQISYKRALEVIRKVSRTTVEGADDYLRDMCKDTGLLTEERDGETLTFIHLTFCEFLAAREAVESNGVNELLNVQNGFKNSGDSAQVTRLTEVIPFVLGLLPRSERNKVLERVQEIADSSMLGRCFLESQAYEHPAWKMYLNIESSRLLATRSQQWDEAWLRGLHLFSVVLADEAEWAGIHFRQPSMPLESLFKKLIKKDRDRLATIFDSYATFDSQAAFRLAYACGVDLVKERPDVIIEHMPDPPFLTTLIEQCKREKQNDPAPWLRLFGEGALSSDYVAARLSQENRSSLPNATPDVSTIPRQKRWCIDVSDDYSILDGGILRESLLTYALTISLYTIDRYSYQTFPRLDLMRKTRPPAGLLFARFMGIGRSVRLVIALAATALLCGSLSLVINNVYLFLLTCAGVALAAINLERWPVLSARYYTGMLLQSTKIVFGSRPALILAPVHIFVHLTTGRKILAFDRIRILRTLRLAPGKTWSGEDLSMSSAELLTTARDVQGRTHRL